MVRNIVDPLSRNDSASALEFIHECLFCQTMEGLSQLLDDLKGIIHYDYAVAVFTESDRCSIDSSCVVNPSYPQDWCDLYEESGFDKIDPIIRESYRFGGLQYWSDTYRKYDGIGTFVSLAEDFGLHEGYSYGAKACTGKRSSLFSFAGRSIERSTRTELIIGHVAPHLHETFCRLASNQEAIESGAEVYFSGREKEVLKWAGDGKTISEISHVLSVSETALMGEISSIFEKLGAANRGQAIAAALDRGVIRID